MSDKGISFIGAGRVASALCLELLRSGFLIRKVVSATSDSCRRLAGMCNASWSLIPEFQEDTNIIIVSVPDDSLRIVLHNIKCYDNTIIVHTAGSLGTEVFPKGLKHTGVFYPLQTFTRNRMIDFSEVNIFIESSDPTTLQSLREMSEALKSNCYEITAENRKMLHVAAVFVNNFTNFMLFEGKEISKKAGIDFAVFRPLADETITKAFQIGPENSQTGPASRSDMGTIKNHIKLLSFSPELQKIYRELTNSIIRLNNKNK